MCSVYHITSLLVHFQVTLTDEQFTSMSEDTGPLTTMTELCDMFKDTAQRLLNHFVQVQGLTISQVRSCFGPIFKPEKITIN